MIRSITGAAFAMLAATSVQAMSPAPMPRPDGMITRVAFGYGIGMTLVNGQCVARAEIRQARRAAYGVGAPYYAGVVRPAYTGTGTWGFGLLGQPYYTTPHYSPYNPYRADLTGLPWYGVRAYYAGGPWYYGTRGWDDYAARDGIVCTPGTIVKGGDGINYVCQ